MRSPGWSSLVFLAGVLAVFGALGWVTFHALRLEKAEQVARADAKHQEKVRLALWRMDAMVAPILAREAARPYFEYRSFYPADTAYTRLLSKVAPGEVLVPSPLLQPSDPFVKLHFERLPSGETTSPEVPSGRYKELADSVYVSGYSLATAEQSLDQLRVLLTSSAPKPELAAAATPAPGIADDQSAALAQQTTNRYDYADSQNLQEYQTRARNLTQATRQQAQVPPAATPPPSAPTPAAPPITTADADFAREADRAESKDKRVAENDANPLAGAPAPQRGKATPDATAGAEFPFNLDSSKKSESSPEPVLVGARDAGVIQREFAPSWIGPDNRRELIYTRNVEAPHSNFTQGFWVDWPALNTALVASVQDLLPGATLSPLNAVPSPDDIATLGRSLASLPAELVAPAPTLASTAGVSTVRSTLLVTWIAALGAVIAIALVLRASLELAERRGRFVSAVTHELRTPLTTFCLYSQMLADGMVPTEEARRSYVKTLNSESQRLARIVESVLDYARLGRSKPKAPRESIAATDLVERLIPPLATRAEQAGMQLEIERPANLSGKVACDPAQVERVLYNLVDNACKYAATADDKRIHLSITESRADLVFTVRDHGPGIDPAEYRRIFRPFFRGQRQADGSTPGLGLGLALAHGLAKECRGDLKLTSTGPNAEFRLRLPLAE